MKIGYIGLGKMGYQMVLRLREKGHGVAAFDINEDLRTQIEKEKVPVVASLEAFGEVLSSPRVLWVMVPHRAVDEVLEKLVGILSAGDIVIDGGNSFYKDSMRRAEMFEARDMHFLDVGVSGGPKGARNGACMMVGGEKEIFDRLEPLFGDLTVFQGYGYVGKAGAGHFAKMIHNGIEYGMMQSIAEGFTILKRSPFKLNLTSLANLYNNGSVIESRLIEWLKNGLKEHGEELEHILGSVGHSGEGQWTIETAKELGISAPALESALYFRKESAKTPSYTGKILSMLRGQFGGHNIT